MSSKIIRKAIRGVKSIHRSQYELAQNRPRDAPVLSSAGIFLQQFMVARKFWAITSWFLSQIESSTERLGVGGFSQGCSPALHQPYCLWLQLNSCIISANDIMETVWQVFNNNTDICGTSVLAFCSSCWVSTCVFNLWTQHELRLSLSKGNEHMSPMLLCAILWPIHRPWTLCCLWPLSEPWTLCCSAWYSPVTTCTLSSMSSVAFFLLGAPPKIQQGLHNSNQYPILCSVQLQRSKLFNGWNLRQRYWTAKDSQTV